MILVSAYSTKSQHQGDMDYNFRKEEDVYRFVYYVMRGNRNTYPIMIGNRGFRSESNNPRMIIEEMLAFQNLYNKLSGLRIRGLNVIISKDELPDIPEIRYQQISQIAYRFSDYIFFSGYQTVYGIFDNETEYKIVYALNPVSFVDGTKFRQNHTNILADEQFCVETAVLETTKRTGDSAIFDFDSLEYA